MTLNQANNFLRRARKRYNRALEGFDDAEKERAAEQKDNCIARVMEIQGIASTREDEYHPRYGYYENGSYRSI